MSCAWSPIPAGPASDPKRRLRVVRSGEDYGCVKGDAAIVVDQEEGRPFMLASGQLLPLSDEFGQVIAGSRLEADIAAALS